MLHWYSNLFLISFSRWKTLWLIGYYINSHVSNLHIHFELFHNADHKTQTFERYYQCTPSIVIVTLSGAISSMLFHFSFKLWCQKWFPDGTMNTLQKVVLSRIEQVDSSKLLCKSMICYFGLIMIMNNPWLIIERSERIFWSRTTIQVGSL